LQVVRHCQRVPSGEAVSGAKGRTPERPPETGGVTIRMSSLKGRLQWRQAPLFKRCANLAAAQ
jgi:hypothetical protein